MKRIQSAGSISPLTGIAFMIIGGVFLTTHNAGLKWLTNSYPVGEIMTLRAVFAFIPILFIAWRSGGASSLRIRNFHAQAARALCFAGAAFLWLLGLRYLPLTDAMSISFTAPILLTALAPFVLGETVGWRRWAAVVTGFCGVLLMISPSGEGVRLAVFLPLAAVAGAVGRDLITRRIAATESSVATLAFTTAVIGASGLVTLPFGWVMPTLTDWLIIAGAGMLYGTAHFFYIDALRLAEAVLVVPFKYSNILWAAVLGFVIWGHIPSPSVIAGTTLVIVSGLYIAHREMLRRAKPVTA
jgi:drug/metabolite transporter (DMT)-like permease